MPHSMEVNYPVRAALAILLVSVISAGCSPAPSPAPDPAPAAHMEPPRMSIVPTSDPAPRGATDTGPQGLADSCALSEQPAFTYGFAALKGYLGPRMGEPISCERTSAETGDSLQQTTRGLARYLKASNVPTFTSGVEHWALTHRGPVYWVGRSVEVPADAQLGLGPSAEPVAAEVAIPVATPASVPTQVAAVAPRVEPAWLQRPLELIADYDRRHGTILSKALESSTVVVTDAPGLWAAFVSKTHTLVLTPELRSESPEAVATVLAHEAMHAVDATKYGGPRNETACYTYEQSAFRLQAAVWQSFYGDPGKVDPATELEEELNLILRLARTDSWRFMNDIKDRYQDECS